MTHTMTDPSSDRFTTSLSVMANELDRLHAENAELRAVVEKLAGPCRVVISAWNKDMIDSDLDAVGHAVNMIRVHIAAAEAAKGEQP